METTSEPVGKRLRVGHVSERGGINAIRTLLEANGLVVDEVDGRADYGRDLNVDITRKGQLTGAIVGVQVKGGRSYLRRGRWVIPASPADWEYWRSSTLTIVGMTWDPEDKMLRWVNLSQRARSMVTSSSQSFAFEVQNDRIAEVETAQTLNQDNFDNFVYEIEQYLNVSRSSSFLELVSTDDEIRARGVAACWTLGRHDPEPMILLRRLLPGLRGKSLASGLTALAHVTSHPDIFWTPANWISEPVKSRVREALRWSPGELVALVHEVEMLDVEGGAWSRGGLGQSLWSIMAVDPLLQGSLERAVKLAVIERRIDAAVRMLICFQWLAANPLDELTKLLQATPELSGHETVNELLNLIELHGRVDIY